MNYFLHIDMKTVKACMQMRGDYMEINVNEIKDSIKDIVVKYPIKKISLFGSFANNTANKDSDIDLLVEFTSTNVSLFILYNIKSEIEDKINKKVDLIHGPIDEKSLLTIDKVVDLYEL